MLFALCISNKLITTSFLFSIFEHEVKVKIINVKTEDTFTYYLGKDGYVHDDITYCEGYIRPCYAQNLIDKQIDNHIEKRLYNNISIENGVWLHIYNVIKYKVA